MLDHWILTGPEISCVVEQFIETSDVDDAEELCHHEEGSASQHHFRCHITDLLDVVMSRGYPYEETSADLATLSNKVCADESAAPSVCILESKGQEKYDKFQIKVLEKL